MNSNTVLPSALFSPPDTLRGSSKVVPLDHVKRLLYRVAQKVFFFRKLSSAVETKQKRRKSCQGRVGNVYVDHELQTNCPLVFLSTPWVARI